ncbi:MAG TPA: hypothetical protein P5341_02645 [Hyphomonas sp.]|nr:hypothetical protein [Hyphomonas sp.]
MDRKPTPSEKALAEFISFTCVAIILGGTLFAVVIGLSHVQPKLGIAVGAICFSVLLIQKNFAQRPWLNMLNAYLTHQLVRMIVSKGR